MRTLLTTCALLLLVCTLAHAAGTITVDITGAAKVLNVSNANQAMITKVCTRENLRRTAQTPPLAALTLNECVADLIVDMFRGYKQQNSGDEHTDACAAFRALTAAQQDSELSRAAWGGNNPCPR